MTTTAISARPTSHAVPRILLHALVLLLFSGWFVLAEILPSQPPKARFAELSVTLTDSRGAPIAEAEVRPWAMQLEGEAGHLPWPAKSLGEPETSITNSEGIAVIRYPESFEFNSSMATTSLLSFECSHPDFVTAKIHFPLDKPHTTVKLERGVQVTFSAVDDETDAPVRNFGVLVSGPSRPKRWRRGPDGELSTGALTRKTTQAMIIAPQTDGGSFFSDVILIDGSVNLKHRFLETPIRKGRRVDGRLADNVPRPVENGYVVINAAPFPLGSSYDQTGSSVVWHDRVDIARDGTFVIPSVPHSGEMQLIAICKHWHASPDAEAPGFISGEFIDLNGELTDLTLPMFPAVTVQISATDPGGRPVSGVTAECWPNQRLKWGGSSRLGTAWNSSILIEDQISDRALSKYWEQNDSFTAETNQQGVVRIESIPLIGTAEPISLHHPDYQVSETEFLNIPPDKHGVIHVTVQLLPRLER